MHLCGALISREAALKVLPPLRSLTARPVFEAVEWERGVSSNPKSRKAPAFAEAI